MVTTGAIIHGKGDYLGYNHEEHPVAVQLGGSDPEAMALCAKRSQELGYDEVNINVGCPSDRVKNGSFGACLMAEPEIVASCVSRMRAEVDIPVTVKCRIGIDDMDEDEDFSAFIDTVSASGCSIFLVHARKAWLQGLSPKQNRDVPPLNYERVYKAKQQRPDLQIIINGGINSLEEAKSHLTHVDGVMLGRQVYSNPYLLTEVDRGFYQSSLPVTRTRDDIVMLMQDYIEHCQREDSTFRPWYAVRHMLGLFQGQSGGKIWRRYLSQNGTGKNAQMDVLIKGLNAVQEARVIAERRQVV